jgi:hypothetical protein
MEGTAEFHHQISDALLPQPDPVFHNATAFDTAVADIEQVRIEEKLYTLH